MIDSVGMKGIYEVKDQIFCSTHFQ
jgi:hypothetical protein